MTQEARPWQVRLNKALKNERKCAFEKRPFDEPNTDAPPLGEEGGFELARRFEEICAPEIVIADQQITRAAMRLIFGQLAANKIVNQIKISRSGLQPDDIAYLMSEFIKNTKHVHSLTLHDTIIGDVGMKSISAWLKDTTLGSLTLTECDLGTAPDFPEALIFNKSLVVLNLFGAKLPMEDVFWDRLMSGIAEHHSLRLLNVGNMAHSLATFQHICNFLAIPTMIENLWIGAKSILRWLETDPPLEVLDLGCGEWSSSQVTEYVADALRKNTHLTEFRMYMAMFYKERHWTQKQMKEIANAIKQNPKSSLEEISLVVSNKDRKSWGEGNQALLDATDAIKKRKAS